jgi:Spy/CpxP family protein refolding chaperone
MRRQFRWALAIMVMFACAASAAQAAPSHSSADECDGLQAGSSQKPQSGGDRRPEHNRVKWWEDATWRGELGITDRQSGKIREIFEVEMVKLRAMREELSKLEAKLAQMVKDDRSSLATLTEKWDRVGSLLSEMYKTRQLMIYRIDRELTPDQRVKLQAMFDKLQAERRQEPDRRR